MSENQPSWMQDLEKICEQSALQASCYLYEMEMTGSGAARTLRVFIDKDGEGAGVEDCSSVSKFLNEALDEKDLIPGGAYMLEVSTPGVERVLRKPWHFEKAVGRKVWLKTKVPMEQLGVTEPSLLKAKQTEAQLASFAEGKLKLEIKKGTFELPIDGIEKAHTLFEQLKKLKP